MVIGNNITSENLITIKELINNWQIASISKKKKKIVWKIRVNSTRLTTRLNPRPVWPATRLTRFKNDPFWPVTRLTRKPDWPDPNPTRPALLISVLYLGNLEGIDSQKPTKPMNDVGKTQQVVLRPKACTPLYIYIYIWK